MRQAIPLLATTAAALLVVACGGGSGTGSAPAGDILSRATGNGNLSTLKVLGNRADLVSGGQALVELVLPDKAKAGYGDVRITRNGEDVTASFAVRPDGRYYGVVGGLVEGDNTIVARVPNGPGARLTVTNHDLGGPVISGPQVQPWTCTTKVANPTASNPDLGNPLDGKCNIAAPVYRYQYRTLAGSFANYDPANPPAAANIASVTTDEGRTVPYIVRIERGVINRGKYDVAYLANPANPTQGWAPWNRSPSWNGKLFWKFGSGCEFGRTQVNPGNVLDDVALRRGFMVASSEMTNYGSHCNDVTSAETVMMVKEHITENYGEIRYTMSDGSSGGAHQQHLHVTNYPGLLQGILPADGWQDTWTTGREFADCGLLKRFYDSDSSGLSYSLVERAQIAGHRWNQVCEGPANTNMASRTPFYMDPTVGGGGCGTDPNRWSLANLSGIRCTLQDFNIAVFGPRDASGYAKTPHDNLGIQYGLAALNAGRITVEQFLRLNELVGGYDINGQWQAGRMVADPGAVEITHASGRVPHGRRLGEVPIIADVSFNIIEEHYDFRQYVIRNRILAEWGDYGNHVILRHKGTPPNYAQMRFDLMNQWLAAIEADTSGRTQREKVLANKPSGAVDQCWRSATGWVTDPAVCNTGATPGMDSTIGADGVPAPTDSEWPVYRDTRVSSGEPLKSDIMKCQLKPLAAGDYQASFTPEQWARLQAAFPYGVCDYGKPGVGQVEPAPWQTFMAGPGGQPLGAAPASQPGDGKGI
ncbi:hypothetical protein H8N03_00130 [Ramlibacter sp. USB13]|uniref:DUF6351 domain-containing protein n=1 Tax=Ramlibacter cellulosilyticus TaxID=2764187 RepID=A0A923MLG5_9BURK|nr:DUF6351 family protein [Ramlibacter cellulosilyticus]MBC5781328.1 hypothetical protein [Ramlibacter cellulosilyticus]